MTAAPPTPLPPPRHRDLSKLDAVKLSASNQRLLASAQATASGPPAWRGRKQVEARDLVATGQESGRYHIDWMDLRDELRALLTIRVPVPCLPDPAGTLQFAPFAQVGLIYQEQAMRWSVPGTSFLQILRPAHVWLPSVASGVQIFCAGTMPAGVRATQLLFILFGALTLRFIEMDVRSPQGVLNRDSAAWWLVNLRRVPQKFEPFILAGEVSQ